MATAAMDIQHASYM